MDGHKKLTFGLTLYVTHTHKLEKPDAMRLISQPVLFISCDM